MIFKENQSCITQGVQVRKTDIFIFEILSFFLMIC
jgi:hypothetical protein